MSRSACTFKHIGCMPHASMLRLVFIIMFDTPVAAQVMKRLREGKGAALSHDKVYAYPL